MVQLSIKGVDDIFAHFKTKLTLKSSHFEEALCWNPLKMSKLKVMEYNRIMLSALGAYPQPFTSSALNCLRFLSPYFIIISLLTSTLLAVAYVYQGSPSLTYTFEAVIIVIGAPQALVLYLNIKWKMDTVAEVNSELQEIVDQGIKFEYFSVRLNTKNRVNFFSSFAAIDQKAVANIYWTVENKCHNFTEQMTKFVVFQQTSFCLAFFYSIYCICVGNFDTSTYYLPLRIAAPFNIDSLLGWYLFWVLQCITGISYMFSMVAVLLYFVFCCFYLQALCDHFDHLIESIDDQFRKNQNKPKGDYASKCARKLLSNTINHHNAIYE